MRSATTKLQKLNIPNNTTNDKSKKATLKENPKELSRPYNYQVTELELLKSGSTASDALSNSNRITVAKLLKGVEKSYDKGAKFLKQAKKTVTLRADMKPKM